MSGDQQPQFLQIKDIPPNIAEELERLHNIVQGPQAHFDRDEKKWAKDKIDQIHKLFFMGAVFIPQNQNPVNPAN